MVMAESERATGHLATSGLDPTTSPASRLQWLKQRREALQEKLARKNNELKKLCISEAELTGILPPEIPLDPGESPPIFRKRVGTSFSYPQNLINKLKTNQVEESALELERQVQAGIATAAYAIVNDLSESKAVRRKHRLIYQQSQKRLKDLESRLNFLRQGYGQLSRTTAPVPDSWPGDEDADQEGPTKHHKTKKPRPPLEPTDREDPKLNDKKWQETEINTMAGATQMNDWHRTRSRYIKPDMHSGTLPALNTVDQNENLDLYLYNDQPRVRTYSHGNWDESSNALRNLKPNQIEERSYRKISDMYALDAEVRQKDHWQQKKLMEHKYNSSMYNPNQRHHIDSFQYKQQHHQFKSKSQQSFYQEPPRDKSSPDIGSIQSLPQYRYPPRPNHSSHANHNVLSHPLMENQRHQDHEFVQTRKNPSETMARKNRGRKSSESSTWCVEEGVWYPPPVDNYQHKDNFGSLDRRKHTTIGREPGITRDHHLTTQHRLEHLPPPPPPPLPPPPHSRMLLRTQSLGSVETWQSGASGISGSATMGRPPGDIERYQVERHQEKEKEWYETSMDLGYSPQQVPPVQRHYPRSSPSPSSISSSPKLLPSPLPPPSPSFNDISVKISQSTEKDLEIPAETSNHAVKYQPYLEVTKPFEMSDFYKYSTKFRKKTEGGGTRLI
ncbi:FERM domain-containing protein 4A isoform X2 [Fopius arisanus]|uniref:FERM domain-containing protein 4A isoform X2 n=1 Tax=Fopius arisanus TaxID=64838 RepID=A0A9R1TP42_9HYME|nr:PREDICTED: FERM domain-containing protein 4A isoform X2 [Fopius arisanus]